VCLTCIWSLFAIVDIHRVFVNLYRRLVKLQQKQSAWLTKPPNWLLKRPRPPRQLRVSKPVPILRRRWWKQSRQRRSKLQLRLRSRVSKS
jgi:hypothetical protein